MTDKPITKSDAQYLLNNIYDDIKALQSTVLDSNTINRLVTLADTAVTGTDVVTSTKNGVCTPAMLNKINSIPNNFSFKAIKCFLLYIPSNTSYTRVKLGDNFTKMPPHLFIVMSAASWDGNTMNIIPVTTGSDFIFNSAISSSSESNTYYIRSYSNAPYVSVMFADVL